MLTPAGFKAPSLFTSDSFSARLLRIADIGPHYAAHAKGGGFATCSDPGGRPWPGVVSARTALAHLGYCDWEHYRGSSYWYGVFDDNRAETAGLAIIPSRTQAFDAGLVAWSSGREGAPEADSLLGATLDWLTREWPISRVGLPGRGDPWDLFRARSVVSVAFEYPGDTVFEGHAVRMLGIDDMPLDYTAYMSNIPHIAGTLQGPNFSSGWPHPAITLDLAFADMCWSEWQHAVPREQFSLGIFTADGTEEVGCLYLSSTDRRGYDVEVSFWFVAAMSRRGADERFPAFVRAWLAAKWPFRSPAFPGREIPWDEWLGTT